LFLLVVCSRRERERRAGEGSGGRETNSASPAIPTQSGENSLCKRPCAELFTARRKGARRGEQGERERADDAGEAETSSQEKTTTKKEARRERGCNSIDSVPTSLLLRLRKGLGDARRGNVVDYGRRRRRGAGESLRDGAGEGEVGKDERVEELGGSGEALRASERGDISIWSMADGI
jgi:hypothetical protein